MTFNGLNLNIYQVLATNLTRTPIAAAATDTLYENISHTFW